VTYIDVEDEDASDEEIIVQGTITARVKSGLLVTTSDGTKGYLPAAQLDVHPPRNLDAVVGEHHRFRVMQFKGETMVLSRRVLLEAERAERRAQTLAALQVGQLMDGVVAATMDQGASIDVGGVDGLLRGEQELEVGDRVRVRVLEFDGETERVVVELAPEE
jgi:small subunit ribosomal protein S1